jgi:hypothetical protein
MNNIHLHSQKRSGLLKDDINKEQELEYRKSLPYDAMGDYSAVSSILPSEIFADCRSEIPNPSTIPAETVNRLGELINLLQRDSWSCKAEQNYYWTFGG